MRIDKKMELLNWLFKLDELREKIYRQDDETIKSIFIENEKNGYEKLLIFFDSDDNVKIRYNEEIYILSDFIKLLSFIYKMNVLEFNAVVTDFMENIANIWIILKQHIEQKIESNNKSEYSIKNLIRRKRQK